MLTNPEAGQLIWHECGLCGCEKSNYIVAFDEMVVVRCDRCQSGRVMVLSRPRQVDDYGARYSRELETKKPKVCFDILKSESTWQTGASIIDVGCGEGKCLDLARESGLQTSGIELDRGAAIEARKRGHIIRIISAEEMWPQSLTADLITMWDLIEHLEAPGRAISHAYQALRPGGLIFIVTPMMSSAYDHVGKFVHNISFGLFPQILRMCWSSDHLYRFDSNGMAKFLSDLGATEIHIKPKLVLSLTQDRYAGGVIMKKWTRSQAINRSLSIFGVIFAKKMNLKNKLLISARKPLDD